MATIMSGLASTLAGIVAPLVKEEVTILWGMKDDLRRLEERIVIIGAVLEDAERKAFTDRAVRAWLANLKDVLYDADDVLDHCRTRVEQLARLLSDGSVPCYSPSRLFSCFSRMLFHYQTGRRIRSINEKLERIIKDQSGFSLITAASAGGDRGSSSINWQTGPLLEPDIVGMQIENDTSHLISLLMREYSDCVPAVPVVAIVGMGGIGKTTLARKIYNHPTIRDNFRMPPPMWVCVSRDYSDTDLLKEVIRCAGVDPATRAAQSFSELELLLAEVIEQKFLLILDDVWSARVWEDLLRKPLQRSAAGSRILITTRDENVAKLMEAVHLHSVQILPVQDGWSLLSNKVLQGGGDRGIEALKDIGFQIVNKCGGLPLAIKTIAGVLMVKERTRQEWERVLNNPAWSLTDLPDGVMGALYLSYQDLPFHLKQCFIYCSSFREDSTIPRRRLVTLWIAHGFVEGDIMEMEEVAEGYYKDLLRRSLLQPHPKYYDYSACSMHDLLRSLALFLAGDEIFVGDIKGLLVKVSASTKLRHLILVDNSVNSIPNVLKERKSLRTLHLRSNSLVDVPLDLFKKLKKLRVLEVHCKNVKRLPETVQNLVHLRSLDLSFSSITELPDAIGNLSNLQNLVLQSCPNLHKLPKGVTELYNLRGLDIFQSPVSGLPTGIGRLQRLRYMNGFVITNESFDGRRGTGARSHQDGWCCMEELGSLSQLRVLSIMNIERAVFVVKARGGFLLKDKSHLIYLELSCAPSGADGQPYGDEEVKRIQEMFEDELHPPNSVQQLEIRGFFGLQFPCWITSRISEVLFNLRWLVLENCRLCKQLPPLGQLPNLDHLEIEGAAAVESVGAEFFGCSGSGERCAQPSSYIPPFPKLEQLVLKNFPNWVDWMWEPEDGAIAMPCLQKLFLRSCPKLRSLPKGIHALTNLHTLFIEGANSITTVENLVCVKHLEIKENTNLVRLSNLPALQELIVVSCPALRDMGILCSLRFLQFKDLAMQFLPEWLMPREGEQQPFPALDKLEIIAGGVHILQRCLKGGPDWPKIQHFSSVRIFVDEKPEFLSYTRDSFTFNVNMGADNGEGSGSSNIRHHN